MNNVYDLLNRSKFRSSFHLKDNDISYINRVGIEKIRDHCYDFINNRLKIYNASKDGKQTPMRGHPVFIAQHATATCCRGCLYKIHKIDKFKELNSNDIDYIVNVIMGWIMRELNKNI